MIHTKTVVASESQLKAILLCSFHIYSSFHVVPIFKNLQYVETCPCRIEEIAMEIHSILCDLKLALSSFDFIKIHRKSNQQIKQKRIDLYS